MSVAMSLSPPDATAPELVVQTWGLTKHFNGRGDGDRSWLGAVLGGAQRLFASPRRRTVVENIELNVRRGEFFGLVGPNGAGKTTLLKLLACLLYPDAGGGQVNGFDLQRQRMAVRRSITTSRAQGWLGLLWQLNGRENLLFRARMCGIEAREAAARVDYILERLNLERQARRYSWELSAGETQKFNLAATFIARAPVVLLDEPTSHLDPQVAREIRQFVKEDLNQGQGQTIILTTHYLEEADLLCDRVALMHGGRLLACDTPAALKQRYAPETRLEIRARNYTPESGARVRAECGLVELLEQFEDLATGQVRLKPVTAAGAAPLDEAALRRALAAEGVIVTALRPAPPTLDDVYVQLMQEVPPCPPTQP